MKRFLIAGFGALALAACGGEEHGDLKQELAQLTKDFRVKEPLEAFPLESIQMLGTITQQKETFALVKAGPNLYRVRKGNYMGQNFGVITGIDEGQVKLKELVQDSGGEWVERNSALQLVEAQK